MSTPGDLWQLGPHRVLCGSALEETSYAALMGGERAAMVFTDPPYNVPIRGHVSGRKAAREFVMASGEMEAEAFADFLATALGHQARWNRDGSLHIVCMDWRHIGELVRAGAAAYSEFKNVCVWTKDNPGMGSLYRSQHELVFVYKQGRAAHRNNVQLGKLGRNRSNVWSYPGDRVGRVCYGLELDPRYADIIVTRWQSLTGDSARHLASGLTFAERAARATASSPAQPKTSTEKDQ